MITYSHEEINLLPMGWKPPQNNFYHELMTPEERRFVFNVPFEKVPLYVTDWELKVYAMWRLKIGK